MTRTIRSILVTLLLAAGYGLQAQNSQVLYYMNLPQRHMLNPALRPSNSFYLGLPALTGINININNNFINFSDVFFKGGIGDSVLSILHPSYDINKFVAKIKENNSIEPQGLVQLFGLGFNAGKDLYIFLDINERIEGNISLPGDILKLSLLGNEQFVGGRMDLGNLRGDLRYYREIGLGFSKNFTPKLRIGVKGKLLLGMAAMSIDNNSLGISVSDNYTHNLDADLTVNLSAPLTVKLKQDNTIDDVIFDDERFEEASQVIDYMLDTRNLGLGIDIGAEYEISEKLKVSAAVTDLGYIKWTRDLTNLRAQSQFEFSGIDLLDVYEGEITMEEYGEDLLDSLKNSFTVTQAAKEFSTRLPVGITFGGSYNLSKNFSLGVVSYTRLIGAQVREALTLSTNINLGNALSTTFAYTAANHRYDNLGAGLAFRLGCFQLYFIADRIPVTWNKIIVDNDTFPLPESWNTVHLRLGMNIAFGNKIKQKDDQPMVISN